MNGELGKLQLYTRMVRSSRKKRPLRPGGVGRGYFGRTSRTGRSTADAVIYFFPDNMPKN